MKVLASCLTATFSVFVFRMSGYLWLVTMATAVQHTITMVLRLWVLWRLSASNFDTMVTSNAHRNSREGSKRRVWRPYFLCLTCLTTSILFLYTRFQVFCVNFHVSDSAAAYINDGCIAFDGSQTPLCWVLRLVSGCCTAECLSFMFF